MEDQLIINIAPITETISVCTINDMSKPEEPAARFKLTPEQVAQVVELIKSLGNG